METLEIIALVVAITIAVILLIYNICKKGLRQTAIDLIILAEKTFESGEGKAKMNSVINGLLNKIPLPIPVSLLHAFAQATFDEIKDALNYRPETKEE